RLVCRAAARQPSCCLFPSKRTDDLAPAALGQADQEHNHLMYKQEAAKFLGVSIRALERYTQQGKLSVRYQAGKTRPVAIYNDKELKEFKTELQSYLYPHRPSVKQENLANTVHTLAGL